MSSVVFVGNIPYDYTEEQLIEIFKQIGPVKNFRLVFDKENGRGKGYGFCEYLDAGNAQSAVRNLDGFDVGNRQLRVAFSDSDQNKKGSGPAVPASQAPPPPAQTMPPAFAQQFGRPSAASVPPPVPPTTNMAALPPLPLGTQPPVGFTATDAISRTLNTMPPTQLLDVIAQFKALVQSNPAQAEALLTQAPALSYAVLQALLLMNLVDAQVLTKVISGGTASLAPPPPAQSGSGHPPPAAATLPPPPHQQFQHPAAATPTPQFRDSPAPTPQVPTVQGVRHSPAPSQMRQSTPQRDPNTAALIAQVMALTDVQINALPQEQKHQIMMIKQQVAAGQM